MGLSIFLLRIYSQSWNEFTFILFLIELGISYSCIAMVTDYDCWKDDTEPVDVPQVLKVIAQNVERVRSLFVQVVKKIGEEDWSEMIKSNQVILIYLYI